MALVYAVCLLLSTTYLLTSAGPTLLLALGPLNNYVDKMRGGGQKMSVFVHAQGIKTVHPGGRG